MKLSVEKSILLKALSHVQAIVERRTVSPILANVLMESEGETLTLTTTDLDISAMETIQAQVLTPGKTTVNALMFYDIVRKLPDGAEVSITLSDKTHQVAIVAGKSKFSLPTLPAEDFSTFETAELPHKFKLTAENLRFLINQTRFAMSSEESRYYLNGIYLHTVHHDGQDFLRTAATDSHRLAKADIPEPKGASGMPGVIIPRKTILELGRLLEDMEGDVEVSLSHTQISFKFENVRLASRLIDGNFPDYNTVIPQDNDLEMTLDRKRFLDAIDRVSMLSNLAQDKTRGVKMVIESGRIIVSSISGDQGSATEEIEVVYDGKRLETGFNSRYLLDIAQQIDSDQARFLFAADNTPVIIQGADESHALYVIMPMRV